ncbi:integrase core domain-containing protein [Oligella urethralis]|uniref:integrase core domain-containing protein n=1 Tax=Oligella urethralis TaxID=90245 RepID=UPI003B83581A
MFGNTGFGGLLKKTTHGTEVRKQGNKPYFRKFEGLLQRSRFNRTYREEVLNMHLFSTLEQVRWYTEEWITIYNTERPHESLERLSPVNYRLRAHSTFGLC